MDTNNTERRQLGLELHHTEMAIHLGRQAMGELLTAEPVNLAALEAQRAVVHDARLARNGLRTRLELAKQAEAPLLPGGWTREWC